MNHPRTRAERRHARERIISRRKSLRTYKSHISSCDINGIHNHEASAKWMSYFWSGRNWSRFAKDNGACDCSHCKWYKVFNKSEARKFDTNTVREQCDLWELEY